MFLLKPDDRYGPMPLSLIGGHTPTGEDAEKDNTLATSPKAERSSSFMPFKKEEAEVSVVDSTDGATAGGKHSITTVGGL